MDRRTFFADVVKASFEDFARVDVVEASYENFEKVERNWVCCGLFFTLCLHVRQPDKVFKMLRVRQSVFC